MATNEQMRLFTKTDTTLVYIASTEFSKELVKESFHYDFDVYIHVGRDKGNVIVYGDNDINNVIPIDIKTHEFILKSAEKDR